MSVHEGADKIIQLALSGSTLFVYEYMIRYYLH